jgi:hypothetical protein
LAVAVPAFHAAAKPAQTFARIGPANSSRSKEMLSLMRVTATHFKHTTRFTTNDCYRKVSTELRKRNFTLVSV